MNAEAEENAGDAAEAEGKKSSLMGIVVWVVVGLVGIVGGFLTPMLLMPDPGEAKETEIIEAPPETEEKTMDIPIPDPNEDVGFVPFDKDVVLNFNDPRQARFLKMNFTLQVAKSQVEPITKLVEEKHDVLRNWLIGHIADKRVEDIRGKQGTNRLRREIHDAFNEILFFDGIERVQDVLFQDLSVQ